MPGVTVAVEGVTDAAVLRKLLDNEGFDVHAVYGLRGKTNLDASLQGFNNAARFSPWLVVPDLDTAGLVIVGDMVMLGGAASDSSAWRGRSRAR